MRKDFEEANRIKALRSSVGMTQVEFSARLDVAQSKISEWEAGKSHPPSEVYLRLGNLAPFPDNIWFWEHAGLSRGAMMAAAKALAKSSLLRPKKGDFLLIPPLQKSAEKGQTIPPDIPFPAKFLANPLAVRYFRIDERAVGGAINIDDILLLDVSHNDAPNLMPFWEQIVLVECKDGPDSSEKEQVLGRLFLRDVPHSGIPIRFAMLQPWNCGEFEIGEGKGRDWDRYKHGDRLNDSGPFILGEWHTTDKDEDETGSHRSTKEITLYPEYRILGVVIAWLGAPRMQTVVELGKPKRLIGRFPLGAPMDQIAGEWVSHVVKEYNGNIERAAKHLGITLEEVKAYLKQQGSPE